MKDPTFRLVSSYPSSARICEFLPEVANAAVDFLLAEHIVEDDQPILTIELPDCLRVVVAGVERLRKAVLIQWQSVGDGLEGACFHNDRSNGRINLNSKRRSLAAGEFVDEGLLLALHLHQALQLDVVALQLGLLLVEQVVQLHHLPLPVLALALPLVPLPQRPQLLLLDLHRKVVQALRQRRHRLVDRNHLGDELHRQALQVVGFSEFLGVQHANVVLLVEGDGQLVGHF